jgi:hypothetical protein
MSVPVCCVSRQGREHSMTDPIDPERAEGISSSTNPDGSQFEGLQSTGGEREEGAAAAEAAKAAQETSRHYGPAFSVIVGVVLVIVAILVAIFTFSRTEVQGTLGVLEAAGPPAGPQAPVAEGGGSAPGPVSSSPCAIQLLDPPSADHIPASGPITLQWTEVPEAANYELEVALPVGSGPAWVVPTKEETKTIYMENFPAAGEYAITVNALSGMGELLCATSFKFTKAASDVPDKKEKDDEGACFNPNDPYKCP